MMTGDPVLLSTVPLSAPIHAVAWFRGAFNPIPSNMESGRTARSLVEDVAPADGPRCVTDKARVPYFVPAELRQAPYVGKTAERHPGEVGYQRSSAHVVSGSWFAFDLDDLADEQWAQVQATLAESGAWHCLYSSWSHGERPGTRARVLVFMDRALGALDWAAAWGVVNQRLLLGLADPATARLSQQAGAWATHPARVGRAFRETGGAALLSADALLRLAPKPAPPKRRAPRRSRAAAIAPERRMMDLLVALDTLGAMNDYATWKDVLSGLRGAVELGLLDEPFARAWWIDASAGADDACRARNHDARYDPAVLWDRVEFTLAPAEARVGKLYQLARDLAVHYVRRERRGRPSAEGRLAANYLAQHHLAALLKTNAENRASFGLTNEMKDKR